MNTKRNEEMYTVNCLLERFERQIEDIHGTKSAIESIIKCLFKENKYLSDELIKLTKKDKRK